ncbi:MAG: type ISP restriction/modification enzyme, partial [Thermodesulfobacteriota bacterium]|nr:type ISP restriction/modification enzyme [Thermodesulfobacteriota bacterium]
KFISKFVGVRNPNVEKISYLEGTVWVDKLKTSCFKDVPEAVWSFKVGGYQVCQKWLKDRQPKGGKKPRPGRILTKEDINHYQKIITAISETLRLQGEIDKVIDKHGGWPNAFVTSAQGDDS